MDLIDRAMAALRRRVLPSVVARGGTVRVVAVEEGTAILEVRGSPGAVLPLASRIQELLGAAVPEITDVQFVGPHAEPPPAGRGERLADRVRDVLDAEINPGVAAPGRRGAWGCHWSRSTRAGSASAGRAAPRAAAWPR